MWLVQTNVKLSNIFPKSLRKDVAVIEEGLDNNN